MSAAQWLELAEQLAMGLALLGLAAFAAYLWRAREAIAIALVVAESTACALFMSAAFLSMLTPNWPLMTIAALAFVALALVSYPRTMPASLSPRLRRVLISLVTGSVVWVVLGVAMLAVTAAGSESLGVRALGYVLLALYSPSVLPGIGASLAGWLSTPGGEIQPLPIAVPLAWLQTVLMAYWAAIFADWRADRDLEDESEPIELREPTEPIEPLELIEPLEPLEPIAEAAH